MLNNSSKGSRGNRGFPVGMAAKTKYIREFIIFIAEGVTGVLLIIRQLSKRPKVYHADDVSTADPAPKVSRR
jgi:hypothetical protein